MLQALHDGAMVHVVWEGGKSDPFMVTTVVRQGCVIAPVIFNLLMAAVFMVAREQLDPADGVPFVYRLDGSLFNLRLHQARTRVTRESVVELQYADDAALLSCSVGGIQRSASVLETEYRRAGIDNKH